MASQVTFVAPNGGDPIYHFQQIEAAVRITTGDLLYAGAILQSEIRQRTARGIDAHGASFQEYSPGYAKRKGAALGMANVDLFGYESHPHMLNAMVVRVGSRELVVAGLSFNASSDNTPADVMQVGFWDEESARKAEVHNTGGQVRTRLGTGKRQKNGGKATFTMPKREFFAANQDELQRMEAGISERVNARLKALK